jgi:hypothetical protein
LTIETLRERTAKLVQDYTEKLRKFLETLRETFLKMKQSVGSGQEALVSLSPDTA